MGVCLSRKPGSEISRRPVFTTIAFIFFANLSDFDFIPGIIVGDPCRYHRICTHSFLFAAFLPLLFYLALRVARLERAAFWSRACAFGLFSHLAMDYFSYGQHHAGLMLLWPWSHQLFMSKTTLFDGLVAGSFAQVFGWQNVLTVGWEFIVLLILIAANEMWLFFSHRERMEVGVKLPRANIQGDPS